LELDEFEALQFEVKQRAVEAALIAADDRQVRVDPAGFGRSIPRRPIVRPIHPRSGHAGDRLLAAAAAGVGFGDLAEETLGAIGRREADHVREGALTGKKDGEIVFSARIARRCRYDQAGRHNRRHDGSHRFPLKPFAANGNGAAWSDRARYRCRNRQMYIAEPGPRKPPRLRWDRDQACRRDDPAPRAC
jgi:hypothetical protein